jgi:predicted nucleic acid-binding protein
VIVLDTNVLSELLRPAPSPQVLRWVAAQPASQLFTTTITQAEILYGIEILPKGKRRSALQSVVEAIFEQNFAGRILPFASDAARLFASIVASRRTLGRPIEKFDAQIAAIARSHGAAIATRDILNFDDCGVTVLNPWNSQ